jgi:phosphate starvation-inducible PhoH-like protein
MIKPVPAGPVASVESNGDHTMVVRDIEQGKAGSHQVPDSPSAAARTDLPRGRDLSRDLTGDRGTDPDDPSRSGESTIVVADERQMMGLLGSRDVLLRLLEQGLAADIHVRGNRITLKGAAGDVALAERTVRELLALQDSGSVITPDTVRRTIVMLSEAPAGDGGAQAAAESPSAVLGLNILSRRGRTIRPKTVNQKRYVDAIDAHTIVFGIGPAGTGKTYLAMAKAVQALQAKQVTRIILTRPAVEAGERLGFLPGTLSDKIDPYLRPLYDALHDMLDPESIPRLMAAGTIEVAPLAYMRGRTLNDAFIILDEAQNTTPEQMKMFLTRLGFGSKIVVTGDVTQIDLPGGQRSGLRVVREILTDIDDISFSLLTSSDVVRHRLVGNIVDAYERWDEGNRPAPDRRPGRPSSRPGRPTQRSGPTTAHRKAPEADQ